MDDNVERLARFTHDAAKFDRAYYGGKTPPALHHLRSSEGEEGGQFHHHQVVATVGP